LRYRWSVSDRERPGKTTLALLLVPVVLTSVMSLTGTALSPALLTDSPLGLVALNAQPRHLVLATNSVDALPFFTVALVRLFLADPFYYLIGRGWGPDAIRWIERKSGGAGKLVRFAERVFARAGVLLVFVAPVNLVCVLAGAARMRPLVFVTANLIGTSVALVLVRWFGAALADPIEVVLAFVRENVRWLTVATIAIVLLSSLARRRRAKKEGGPVDREVDPSEV
jgi:membrane protein DedA with SNARE-associated domain